MTVFCVSLMSKLVRYIYSIYKIIAVSLRASSNSRWSVLSCQSTQHTVYILNTKLIDIGQCLYISIHMYTNIYIYSNVGNVNIYAHFNVAINIYAHLKKVAATFTPILTLVVSTYTPIHILDISNINAHSNVGNINIYSCANIGNINIYSHANVGSSSTYKRPL